MPARPTTTGIPEIEHAVMGQYLAARAVPLTYEHDGRALVHGTGLFFRSRGVVFLVTAAHVLEDIHIPSIGVPDRYDGDGVPVWSLGDVRRHWPVQSHTFDFTVVELLNPNFLEQVAAHWQFIDESEVDANVDARTQFVIAGYPSATVPEVDGVLTTKEPMLQLFTGRYDGDVDEPVHDYELMLKQPSAGKRLDGTQRDVPRLEGLSGSAVYSVSAPSATVWSPEQTLKLVGIQVSAKHGSYARVMRWSLIADLVNHVHRMRSSDAVAT